MLQRHLGWKAGIPAYTVATYVAASRIQVQRHYLSDVAFGAAIGMIAGRTVTIGRGEARFAVAPAAAPGGAGVNFTWVGRRDRQPQSSKSSAGFLGTATGPRVLVISCNANVTDC